MIKGIHLTLLMGPTIAVPVPRPVIDALESVEIQNNTAERDVFRLTFRFSRRSVLGELVLLLGQSGPTIRTILIATMNGFPHVLIDGVVTNHQVSPDLQNGTMSLTVTGDDLTALMDRYEVTVPYPAMPPEARVAMILAKYAAFGVIPLVIPRIIPEVPNPLEKIPTQRGKDLAYVKALADDAGYVFYIDPGPAPGTSVAYWGPEIRIGVPQPALSVDMDAFSNVESVNFTFDATAKTMPIILIQNPQTKLSIPIPVPDINPLKPPLGLVPMPPTNIEMMQETAKQTPPEAAMTGIAEASKTSDTVTATGTLDVLRYGHILKSRQLVGLRGVGIALGGLYFVKKVVHKIQRGEYKQDFTLVRNGLISTVPVVPV